MLTCRFEQAWEHFLECVKKQSSSIAFDNWLAPIKLLESQEDKIILQVPNVFVKNYLLDNYKNELISFLPVNAFGEPLIEFVIAEAPITRQFSHASVPHETEEATPLSLNKLYHFENFIEGPSNQFVKSAALGIAKKPGKSYNPFFIHGGVGLGKTHLLHAIGHDVQAHHKKLKIQCITTEAFINDLVDSLKNKTVEKMKKFYRSLDVLLVDDIQFLQNRLNFEEELSNTFETLINQHKQIVITSDKPPGQLKLSERMVARMEWGLVAHIGAPDLETRVAILQHKAAQRGIKLSNQVAFFIAENIYSNVRQLEGAINRLCAHCRLFDKEVTEEFAEQTLCELFQQPQKQKLSVEAILKTVATVFEVKITDLRGTTRTKEIALPRQVAMYLAKELMQESLFSIATSFGKTHSTVLHAHKTIETKLQKDESLKRQIALCRRHIPYA